MTKKVININHPEFSNIENSGFFMLKNVFITVYALFLATLERRAGRYFLGASVFFNENLRFFLKNTLAPIDFLAGRLLSVAKNSQ
jgi:hypothetical protein